MFRDIQAVAFDLDDTLLDRRRSFEQFARRQWERFSQPLDSIEQDRYVHVLIELDRNGYAPRKGLFAGMAAQFGLPADLAETLLNDYRAGFPSACVLFPDALRTLETLRASGLKLALITNGSMRMQSRKLECLALSAIFDAVLISDAEGVSKPDPRIFHLAVERLGVRPDRALFVGDNLEVDVAGARAAGLHAIWCRDGQASPIVAAETVIDRLTDLLPLLGLSPRAS
jgi:putative hydrolase of the HAD superfamily